MATPISRLLSKARIRWSARSLASIAVTSSDPCVARTSPMVTAVSVKASEASE